MDEEQEMREVALANGFSEPPALNGADAAYVRDLICEINALRAQLKFSQRRFSELLARMPPEDKE
jgi:hypothetical protein